MSNPLLAPQIKSKLDTSTETFAENKTAMMEKLEKIEELLDYVELGGCLLYTSPSPRDQRGSRMPSSA